MTIYITKYGLTSGILEVEGTPTSDGEVLVSEGFRFKKPWWHTDLQAAQEQIKTMVAKKIATLQRQVNEASDPKYLEGLLTPHHYYPKVTP